MTAPGGGHVRIIGDGDSAVDPDGLLLALRRIARAITTAEAEQAPAEERAGLASTLAQLVITLDHYMTGGGVPPGDWQPVQSWQQGMRRAQLPGPARHRRRPW